MKRKFLITNDVGLALDKIKFLVDCINNNGGDGAFLHEYEVDLLNSIDHLEQALDNLGYEEEL